VKSLLPAVLLLFQAVISVRSELVTVPVTVTDTRGQQVNGLIRENFRVFEDGRPQPIAVFHHGEAPVTLGLVVDRSQSMRPKNDALLITLSALLRTSRPDDELFAVGFNDLVSFVLPPGRQFTNDVDEIETRLSAMPAEGRTALYDGVAQALQQLQLGHGERRALIVVSDGGDNGSSRMYSEVLALARRSDAVIYAIGLLNTAQAQEDEDMGLLKRLCKDTGGLAVFPRTAAEIVELSAQVARDIREQYMLGFVPGPRTDGPAFRKIKVTVTAPAQGRFSVRARSGYVVAEDKAKP
jgi:Ca-activated chloride channel homolog